MTIVTTAPLDHDAQAAVGRLLLGRAQWAQLLDARDDAAARVTRQDYTPQEKHVWRAALALLETELLDRS